MNLIIKFFRFAIFTLIILPVWLLTCFLEFFIAVILHYLFSNEQNLEIKYRNNIKKLFEDFQYNFISIFYYY
jgi:hypothetical protein